MSEASLYRGLADRQARGIEDAKAQMVERLPAVDAPMLGHVDGIAGVRYLTDSHSRMGTWAFKAWAGAMMRDGHLPLVRALWAVYVAAYEDNGLEPPKINAALLD